MKKVCVITGTRAEYGLLKPVMERIRHSEELLLQLIVTGTHLSPEFGMTYREIEADGYPITDRVEMLLSSDTSVGITKSMAVGLMGFADYFERNRPDIVVILGDRYEMLMAASAAMIASIPIAHIHGGEITEGAYDDAIRHSITKMSYLHFAATESYRKRIIQLGENPDRVYAVGALGVENLKTVSLLSRKALEKELDMELGENTIMVTYHPVTLEALPAEVQFGNLLQALDQYPELQVIFTKANGDNGGRIINQMIEEYVEKNTSRCAVFASLGQVRYLSTLQFCRAVVGNSSSGIIEVPSFHIPTINIGDRQQGRICAESVIHCRNASEEISDAIKTALTKEFADRIKKTENPYEGENTSKEIIRIIKTTLQEEIDLKKSFYDLPWKEEG